MPAYIAIVIFWLIFDDNDGTWWRPPSFPDSFTGLLCSWRIPGNSPMRANYNKVKFTGETNGTGHIKAVHCSYIYTVHGYRERERESVPFCVCLSLPWLLHLGHSSVPWWNPLSLHWKPVCLLTHWQHSNTHSLHATRVNTKVQVPQTYHFCRAKKGVGSGDSLVWACIMDHLHHSSCSDMWAQSKHSIARHLLHRR